MGNLSQALDSEILSSIQSKCSAQIGERRHRRWDRGAGLLNGADMEGRWEKPLSQGQHGNITVARYKGCRDLCRGHEHKTTAQTQLDQGQTTKPVDKHVKGDIYGLFMTYNWRMWKNYEKENVAKYPPHCNTGKKLKIQAQSQSLHDRCQ